MLQWDVWAQFLAAFLCNVGILTFGLQEGWVSPLQPLFQSDQSPLGLPMTDEQISWIGALPCITLTISAPIFGWTMAKYGRRATLFLATAPNLISYLLIIVANDVNLVYISRLLGGFCACGSFVVGPIYVNEMVQPHLRGFLGSITGFFIKLGIILAFILGAYVSYLTFNLISASFTILFVVIYPWLPESPVYLVSVGKTIEAESAYRKLWRGGDAEAISREIETVQNSCLKTENQLRLRQLFANFTTDRRLRNAMIIVTSIYSLQMLSGYPAITRFAVDVVSDAGSAFSAYDVAIFLAALQLIASVAGSALLDKLGRKPLIVYNFFFMAISMATLAVYLFIKTNHPEVEFVQSLTHLPTIVLLIFFVCYSLGFSTVPFVIISELFIPEERPVASTILNIIFSGSELIAVKLFHPISALIYLHGAIGIFAMFSFIGTGLLAWRMFETKGLTLEEVQSKLAGNEVNINVEKNSIIFSEKSQPLLPISKTSPQIV